MNFKHKDWITCVINRKAVTDARIYIDGGKYYICQNSENGNVCKDKLGYKFSWQFRPDTPHVDGVESIQVIVESIQVIDKKPEDNDSIKEAVEKAVRELG